MSEEGKKKVDEDWKRRAQMEREADMAKAGGPAPKASPAPAAPGAPPAAENPNKLNPLFPSLIESLAQQALMYLGGMRDPMTGQVVQDLHQSQTLIDMLSMIEEKTKGNLAAEEAEMLKQVLDELRTQYVRAANPGPRAPKGPPMMGNRPPGR